MKHIELRITLDEITPAVWRRFLVPPGITLARLHDVIQIVMGWTDSHLHKFRVGEQSYTSHPDEFDPHTTNSAGVTLEDLLRQDIEHFEYVYDYGDNWRHRINMIGEAAPLCRNKHNIRCLDGAGACPPEDVGGPFGYTDMLEALADATHDRHEEFVGWLGGTYDPVFFDIEVRNRALAEITSGLSG